MNTAFFPKLFWVATLALASNLNVQGDPPAWWTDGDPPAWDLNAEPNNKGPANIGQAKWMASEALRALQDVDPALAAAIRNDLILPQPNPNGGTIPPILDFSVPDPKPPGWIEKQKSPLLIGQLKAISAPFYSRLNSFNSAWLANQRTANGTNQPDSIFPWTSEAEDDSNTAIATVGQLKAVFSLRFESLPTSNPDNGLPDEWEMEFFGTIGVDPNRDPDGDGLTNVQEFALGTSPIDMDTDHDGIPDGEDSNPVTFDFTQETVVQVIVLTPLF